MDFLTPSYPYMVGHTLLDMNTSSRGIPLSRTEIPTLSSHWYMRAVSMWRTPHSFSAVMTASLLYPPRKGEVPESKNKGDSLILLVVGRYRGRRWPTSKLVAWCLRCYKRAGWPTRVAKASSVWSMFAPSDRILYILISMKKVNVSFWKLIFASFNEHDKGFSFSKNNSKVTQLHVVYYFFRVFEQYFRTPSRNHLSISPYKHNQHITIATKKQVSEKSCQFIQGGSRTTRLAFCVDFAG